MSGHGHRHAPVAGLKNPKSTQAKMEHQAVCKTMAQLMAVLMKA
eukprot:SAG25_NODE_14472_length_254_cov_1.329032_1_plen_43_part_01